MKYRLYHNPRCRKSREGLELVQNKGIEFTTVNYMNDGISEAELAELLIALGMHADDLCRKKEDVYKDFVKAKGLKEADLIRVMVQNPKLIERPILFNTETKKAAIGRPSDEFLKVI